MTDKFVYREVFTLEEANRLAERGWRIVNAYFRTGYYSDICYLLEIRSPGKPASAKAKDLA
jgi:hypothetical protein